MHHTSDISAQGNAAPAISAEEEAGLRAEIMRLKRENRALSIALEEMERIAERDMLTPLYNRRYFLSALHQRIARVERFHECIALFFIDVNGLKAVNDRLGHAAGDFALIEVANRLSAINRDGDVLARIGGDEFGMLVHNISQTEARSRLRLLRQAIESDPCHFGDEEIPLSAAFGMAMITVDATAEELLGRADEAMYRSKRAH